MKLHSILFENDERKVALVVLTYNNQVLILKRASRSMKWGFPGGGIKDGETALMTACRYGHKEII